MVAACAAGVTTIVLGLIPKLQTRRLDLRSAIQAKDFASHGGNRLRSALAVVEIDLSVILLAGTGLFLKALHQSQSIELGFKPGNVLLLSVDFNATDYRYDGAAGLAFYRRVLERVTPLPGVLPATWGGDVPLALRQQCPRRGTKAGQLRLRNNRSERPVKVEGHEHVRAGEPFENALIGASVPAATNYQFANDRFINSPQQFTPVPV